MPGFIHIDSYIDFWHCVSTDMNLSASRIPAFLSFHANLVAALSLTKIAVCGLSVSFSLWKIDREDYFEYLEQFKKLP